MKNWITDHRHNGISVPTCIRNLFCRETIGNHTQHHWFCWDILLLQNCEEALTMHAYSNYNSTRMPVKYIVKILLFQKFTIATRRTSCVKFGQVGSII